jgi:hypothetical protein
MPPAAEAWQIAHCTAILWLLCASLRF